MYSKVTIIGAGLIGGSLALLIKRLRPDIKITGVDLPEITDSLPTDSPFDNLFTAEKIGDAVGEADLSVLALPNIQILKTLPDVLSLAKNGSVVCDVGSVKQPILKEASKHSSSSISFIGGHPIGGSEEQGFEAASADLLNGVRFIICPAENVSKEVTRTHTDFLESLNFKVLEMEASVHDKLIAFTSHLPQLLSTALSLSVGSVDKAALTVGPGFSATTRLAASPAKIWDEIFQLNKENLLDAVNTLTSVISDLKDKIENGSIEEQILLAAKLRSKMLRED